MLREIDEELVSPEKLLSVKDSARLGCGGCAGCSACCRGRGSLIVLDAWDVEQMKDGLNYSFPGLVNSGLITLSVVDGVVLPCLPVDRETDSCSFLNEAGRCGIYDCRPGICRMFPLARIYHPDGRFSYFLQEGECSRSGGQRINIAVWLGYPDIEAYEKKVRQYHDALVRLRKACAAAGDMRQTALLQQAFLEEWFG